MLRGAVLVAGLIGLGVGTAMWAKGERGAGGWMLSGALAAGGILVERVTYKRELATTPGAGWEKTAETSVDADGVVNVWFNPSTGERAYVRERR